MFNWLKQRIIDVVQWVADLFVAVFEALWDLLSDTLAFAFESILDIVISAVQSIDVSVFDGVEANWGSLPGEIINVLGLLGVGQASTMILGAIGLRLLLQLIPFTRFGS